MIISCPECGKDISNQAQACPHCGKQRPLAINGVRVVLLLIVGIALFYWIGSSWGPPLDENLEPVSAPAQP